MSVEPHPRSLTAAEAQVAQALGRAQNILAITGAGISAESGLPTFRGEGGWWRNYRAEDLATPAAFERHPRTVWEWYDYRRGLVAKSQPNAAHRMLTALERHGKSVFIITQNVDDLHERAGSANPVHVHGSIWRVVCLAERRAFEDRRVPLPELPPRCECGGLLRPGVVWFGEQLPAEALATIDAYFDRIDPEVVLVIGTEAVFGYIQSWAAGANRRGGLLVEINPSPTVLTPYANVSLQGRAGEILGSIQSCWEG
jgi:NAD-dependent protein deacetylase/lipoamidase